MLLEYIKEESRGCNEKEGFLLNNINYLSLGKYSSCCNTNLIELIKKSCCTRVFINI
jgi:hypothetical protein